MPKPTERRVYTQGDDIKPIIRVYDSTEKTNLLNISNWTFAANLANSIGSNIATLDIDVSALASSQIKVLISRNITSLLTPDIYYYDLSFRDASNNQRAAYTYELEILKQITRFNS